MIEDREKLAELNKGLQKDLQTAESYGDQLRATLQKHNLTHLANKRPSHIERKMQNATKSICENSLRDSLEQNRLRNCLKTARDKVKRKCSLQGLSPIVPNE